MAFRSEFSQLLLQRTVSVEQFLRPVTLHPLFQDSDVFRLVHVAHGNLMASPIILALLAVDLGRTGPSFRRPENDHWPDRAFAEALAASIDLDFLYVGDRGIERLSHLLMHSPRLVPFDEIGLVPV